MNEREFRAAFHDHKEAVYRFAWRMTNSPAAAEDIAQEVFLCILRQPLNFDGARAGSCGRTCSASLATSR
jgi:DNA-directed RNA polymerase specialized sigma24 family protein